MYDLTFAAITETQATEQIMTACRANEKREEYVFPNGDRVTFKMHIDGCKHEAALRIAAYGDVVCALATVDAFDN